MTDPLARDETIFDHLAASMRKFVKALRDYLASWFGQGNRADAKVRIVTTMADACAEADMIGRRSLLAEASLEGNTSPVKKTIEEMVTKLYLDHHAKTLLADVDESLTERLEKAFADGKTSAVEAMKDMEGWTQAYAETVYDTQMARAYTAGRFQQALDPDVADLLPSFEFFTMNDVNVRPNHQAARGLVAAATDPVWDTFSPPLGFRCRCKLRTLTRYDLEERGLVRDGKVVTFRPKTFAKAGPDKGFVTGRPGVGIYQ